MRFPRVSVSGYQLPAIRRPSRYGATGANTLRMSPNQSKDDPSICQDLGEWYGNLRRVRGLEKQVTVDLRDGAFICADRA